MWRPESRSTDPLTTCSDSLEETATEGSCRLLSHTTGPYNVLSATERAVAINKDGAAIPVSVDRGSKMPRVPDEAEPLVGLHNTMGHLDLHRHGPGRKSNHLPTGPDGPKPTEHVIDRVAGHHGTGNQSEYKVRVAGHQDTGNQSEYKVRWYG